MLCWVFQEFAKSLQTAIFPCQGFPSISGYLLGLLHGCCTDSKACMRTRSGMIVIRPTAWRPFM
jgi:hypothetical protein